MIETVAIHAAKASFWEALTDFAVTIKIPNTARTLLLTLQPFMSWHVVLISGNGMRVIRR
jgi:phage antirepressor YoqD-like protein